jgi:hypothetical protein
MASCTVPTSAKPDSSTVIPAATTSAGSVPCGSTPVAKKTAVAPVARNPPTTWRKNAGSRRRPVASMTAVTRNATPTAIPGDPSSSASAPASPAEPDIETQRGYGWVARTASSSATAVSFRPSVPRSTASTSRYTVASRVRSSPRWVTSLIDVIGAAAMPRWQQIVTAVKPRCACTGR